MVTIPGTTFKKYKAIDKPRHGAKLAKTGKREVLPIQAIKPHPKNAKLHPKWQIEKLGQLIDLYGYDQIIVIDEKNLILKGHGRWESLVDRGYTHVEVERKSGLSEDEKLAMMISDNKIVSNMWNTEILSKVLPALDKKGLDTGFTEAEIKKLSMDPKLAKPDEVQAFDLSPKLYEKYDYIVLFFKTELDFKFAKQVLDLKIVRDRIKHQKVGLLRAIDGIEALNKIKDHFSKIQK